MRHHFFCGRSWMLAAVACSTYCPERRQERQPGGGGVLRQYLSASWYSPLFRLMQFFSANEHRLKRITPLHGRHISSPLSQCYGRGTPAPSVSASPSVAAVIDPVVAGDRVICSLCEDDHKLNPAASIDFQTRRRRRAGIST